MLALAVDREFAAATAIVRTLAGSVALARGEFGRFRDELEAAARQWPGAIIGLTGPDGFLSMTTRVPMTVPMPMLMSTNTAARQALTTGRTEISDLYQGSVSTMPQVAVAVPAEVRTDGREPARHAVSIVLPYQTFVPILAGKGMPRAGRRHWLTARATSSPAAKRRSSMSGVRRCGLSSPPSHEVTTACCGPNGAMAAGAS
ncbi:PDC sensor domain-containing protein [Siccirubricoccus deserti]